MRREKTQQVHDRNSRASSSGARSGRTRGSVDRASWRGASVCAIVPATSTPPPVPRRNAPAHASRTEATGLVGAAAVVAVLVVAPGLVRHPPPPAPAALVLPASAALPPCPAVPLSTLGMKTADPSLRNVIGTSGEGSYPAHLTAQLRNFGERAG